MSKLLTVQINICKIRLKWQHHLRAIKLHAINVCAGEVLNPVLNTLPDFQT